jgi:hypothetical protein
MTLAERRRVAVLDNAALCVAMWRAHGLEVERVDGCVACSGTPPRFYPHVVTVDPTVDPRDQMRFIAECALRARGAFCVKDSYRALALDNLGFEPLFDGAWIHRRAERVAAPTRLFWRRVEDDDELARWEAAWSGGAPGPRLFVPAFLAGPEVTILAGMAEDAVVAGGVVTMTGAEAGLSNVFGDAMEVIRAAAATVLGRDLVGYETGDALAAALVAGFETVGALRVWKRPEPETRV